MNALTRCCSSLTFGEYSKSMGASSGKLEPFDLRPGEFGERSRRAARLERLRARSVALQGASHHALHDRGDAEHVVDHVVLPVARLDAGAAGAAAIGRHVFPLGRDAERGEIEPAETTEH